LSREWGCKDAGVSSETKAKPTNAYDAGRVGLTGMSEKRGCKRGRRIPTVMEGGTRYKRAESTEER
jgi:hypothetical protein